MHTPPVVPSPGRPGRPFRLPRLGTKRPCFHGSYSVHDVGREDKSSLERSALYRPLRGLSSSFSPKIMSSTDPDGDTLLEVDVCRFDYSFSLC
jgi:hypothetical protein